MEIKHDNMLTKWEYEDWWFAMISNIEPVQLNILFSKHEYIIINSYNNIMVN